MKKISFIMIAVLVIGIMSFDLNTPKDNKVLAKEDGANRLKESIVLYVGSPVTYSNNNEMLVDNTNSDVIPYVKKGRTLVPVRYVAEKFGAEVSWDGPTRTVTIKKHQKEIKIVIGSNNILVSNSNVKIDVPAEINNSRTYIPLRAMAESLGKEVFYDRGLIIISEKEKIFDIENEKEEIDAVISKVNNLPKLISVKDYKKLLEKYNQGTKEKMYTTDAMDDVVMEMARIAPTVNGVTTTNSKVELKSKDSGYSKTNVQVQGVDEADVVKTDGEFIYQINNQKVIITKAYPAEDMKVVTRLDLKKEINPRELYIDDKYMVVIGQQYQNQYQIQSIEPRISGKNGFIEEDIVLEKRVDIEKSSSEIARGVVGPWNPTQIFTKAIIFDIENKSDIKRLRDVEIEGNYVSSRKINNSLYLITNKHFYWYNNEKIVTPQYLDTLESKEYKSIAIEDIRYFPGMVEPNYMVIAGINIDKKEPAKISTYLGAGQNIYASLQNLYVTTNKYINRYQIMKMHSEDIDTQEKHTNYTDVYKFSLANSSVTYLNKGNVPGSILNQFSMDENGENFRIVTTSNKIQNQNKRFKSITANNLYILDETMNIAGKIEDIAPGERIYSARFMGDRAYVVTFKNVDPLFVINVKDPKNPSILGALKIPGYSNYLHPYDENHIIGFGKDTVEIKGRAYEQGVKVALFDVSDVSNPIQKFSELIGDRGTDSELLRNHKALLFSKEKGIMAFPVTVRAVDNTINKGENIIPQYGQFKYQGAYVYNVDIENGFKLKGKVSHLSKDDYLKSGMYDYNHNKYVERILYINNNLYTISKEILKANDLSNLNEINSIKIK